MHVLLSIVFNVITFQIRNQYISLYEKFQSESSSIYGTQLKKEQDFFCLLLLKNLSKRKP